MGYHRGSGDSLIWRELSCQRPVRQSRAWSAVPMISRREPRDNRVRQASPMLVPGPVFVHPTCPTRTAHLSIPTMTPEAPRSTLICVDNGGTLTDAIAVRGGRFFRAKAITTAHDL